MVMTAARAAELLNRLYIHTCTVTPVVSGALPDADNQVVWTTGTPVTGQPCRMRDLSRQEIIDATEQGTLVYSDSLLVPLTVTVDQRYRVSDVRDLLGQAVDSGTFEVVQVLTRRTTGDVARECLLREVR